MTATPQPQEEGGWLGPLAGALVEALPRLYGEPLDPLVGEVIRVLGMGLGQGQLELSLQGPAPEGISAAEWPEGHRRALSRSRLCQEPDGPLALVPGALPPPAPAPAPTTPAPMTQAPTAQAPMAQEPAPTAQPPNPQTPVAVAWRRWSEQREQVLAELLARAARPPAWARHLEPPSPESATTNTQQRQQDQRRLRWQERPSRAHSGERGVVLLGSCRCWANQDPPLHPNLPPCRRWESSSSRRWPPYGAMAWCCWREAQAPARPAP
jgi:hypothetical protein